jgi:hypothetical protein
MSITVLSHPNNKTGDLKIVTVFPNSPHVGYLQTYEVNPYEYGVFNKFLRNHRDNDAFNYLRKLGTIKSDERIDPRRLQHNESYIRNYILNK